MTNIIYWKYISIHVHKVSVEFMRYLCITIPGILLQWGIYLVVHYLYKLKSAITWSLDCLIFLVFGLNMYIFIYIFFFICLWLHTRSIMDMKILHKKVSSFICTLFTPLVITNVLSCMFFSLNAFNVLICVTYFF